MPTLGLSLALALLAPSAAAPPPAAPHMVVVSPGATAARGQGPTATTTRPAARPVPIISLSVKDADLVEVIRSFARIADINLIVDPGVHGTVTAELVNVRWDQALSAILRTQGLGMEIDGRILTVAPPVRLIGGR